MSDGGKGCQNSDNLRTDKTVAKKIGIWSRDTYHKNEYIVDNKEYLTSEYFGDWERR